MPRHTGSGGVARRTVLCASTCIPPYALGVTRQKRSNGSGDEIQGPADRWHDDPISSVTADRLGRTSFAEHAARLIRENHTMHSSVVYGLEGPWGSGKSSVITLITAFLTGPGETWRVVPFTPWATTGTEGLFSEFFAALSTMAPEATGNQRLRERLTAYAEIARPIAAVIPMVGAGIAEASRSLEDRIRKPWNVAFAEVAENYGS